MKRAFLFGLLCASAWALACSTARAASEARVTQVVRDVTLLPENAKARPASLNDQVREGLAVRTGDQSRSELTFPDVTITRLGANSIFSFDQGGHDVSLNGGSVLLRVPKDAGGGSVRTSAISVAITGTTLIVEAQRSGRNKLYVLEGSARLSLNRNRREFRDVRAGQLLDVPAGATTLPEPQNVDLNRLMKTHPLITGFRPLPSRDLIAEAARNPPPDEPIYQGQPVSGGPLAPPVISVGGGFPGVGLPGTFPGPRSPGRPGNPAGTTKPGTPTGSAAQQPTKRPTRARPTPTPPIR